ncbi:RHS repeat-associated core domain [Chryseobacterium indologenes]|nr:RHS repeat-associated core domain-containing protein [Chryseobacterium indologenes]ASE62175.1 hypothetical protein CEQ15_12065 [Chryseobacterium indologenes]VFA41659.1 RHS repeat-associated core domain [Chryseobacterium indologenes]
MNHLKSGNAFFGAGTYKNYKYQGQELQETGWYRFKWRNYMPDTGRFFNIDPLSEKYAFQSHYNFSENRVIDARELEGLEAKLINENTIEWRVKISNNLGREYSKTLLDDTSKILSQNGIQYNIVEDSSSPFTLNLSLPKLNIKTLTFTTGTSAMDGNTYDGEVTSQDTPRTVAHELGHKAGLNHIFENSSKVPNTKENMDNLMNSDSKDQVTELRNSEGTKLKDLQSQDMKTHIKIKYENKEREVKQNLNNKKNNTE